MAATVEPGKLAFAMSDKLGGAQSALIELQQADGPEFTPNIHPQQVVAHFLLAARGVHATAKTFAKDHVGTDAFKAWLENWESALSASDRTLWARMATERRKQEHGDGVSLVAVRILAGIRGHSLGEFKWPPTGPAMAGTYKDGVRFEAYPDKPISEVCLDYFSLCSQFTQDFVGAHRAAITNGET